MNASLSAVSSSGEGNADGQATLRAMRTILPGAPTQWLPAMTRAVSHLRRDPTTPVSAEWAPGSRSSTGHGLASFSVRQNSLRYGLPDSRETRPQNCPVKVPSTLQPESWLSATPVSPPTSRIWPTSGGYTPGRRLLPGRYLVDHGFTGTQRETARPWRSPRYPLERGHPCL